MSAKRNSAKRNSCCSRAECDDVEIIDAGFGAVAIGATTGEKGADHGERFRHRRNKNSTANISRGSTKTPKKPSVRFGMSTTRVVNLGDRGPLTNNDQNNNNNNNAALPPCRRQKVAHQPCCNCSRFSTCVSRNTPKKLGCPCLMSGRKCTCCAPGINKCQN